MKLAGCGIVIFCVLAALPSARADLPLHCLPEDVLGHWTFTTDGAPHTDGQLPACGHSIPNTVSMMLALVGEEPRQRLVPELERFEVTLTDRAGEANDHGDRKLLAVGPDGELGSWTMVFDEGFEVKLGGRSFFAHFEFEALPGAKSQNGDMLDTIGEFFGRADGHDLGDFSHKIYGCHCERTSIGWHSVVVGSSSAEGGSSSHRGCFFARRSGGASTRPATVRGSNSSQPAAFLGAAKVPQATRFVVLNETGSKRIVGHSPAAAKPVSRHRPPMPASHATGQAMARSELPANWDWRSQPELSQYGDDLAGAFDQGACGSCWAVSGVLALGMRFRIGLQKKLKRPVGLDLSWRGMTRCSPYNEGCSGGFTLLVGRMAQETGVYQQTTTTARSKDGGCDVDAQPDMVDQACPSECMNPNPATQPVYFAKDYGYVGGFAQGASEDAIMHELYQHGPISIELSVKAIPMLVYGNAGGVIIPFDNHRPIRDDVPDKTAQLRLQNISRHASQTIGEASPVDFKHWLWVDHALLSVGWGEEPVDKMEGGEGSDVADPIAFIGTLTQLSFLQRERPAVIKYWHIRNSWTKMWGDGGYGKLVRGQNAGGIEVSAVWITPDLDRLPAELPLAKLEPQRAKAI